MVWSPGGWACVRPANVAKKVHMSAIVAGWAGASSVTGSRKAVGRAMGLSGQVPAAAALRKARVGLVSLALRICGAALAVAWCAGPLQAGLIAVPNGSFESPQTDFVDIRIDFWSKTPKPAWWDENAYGPWEQLTGVFLNVPPQDPRHIDNCDGRQAVWLFANPEVGLFQELSARFQVGRAYELTVGLFPGSVYPMEPGATVELSLYYRDAASNRQVVAALVVTNTDSVFSNQAHHLNDFRVSVPLVQATDPWAGQPIGIALMSTVLQVAGGYWVLDNVRLTELRAPGLSSPIITNGLLSFRIEGEPGQPVEILASANVALPLSNWVSLGLLSNETGTVVFTEPATNSLRRFYRARQWP